MIKLYPEVKIREVREGYFTRQDVFTVYFSQKKVNAFIENEHLFSVIDNSNADIIYQTDEDIPQQGYTLEITPQQILISHSDDAGAYYATQTLIQLIRGNDLQCTYIKDEPDIAVRGFMLDISRDKIQKNEEIKRLIKQMSALRMNHLELYVEGFSFEYQSFKQFLEEDGFISVKEYQELELYANEHFIDLVPNQNGFGHMAKWLEKEQFKELAECEGKVFMWGRDRDPSTLNPLDPRSIELVHQMYDDMLPYTKSKYFNMNFDEPFELGRGKAKEECDRRGIGNVYIDYALKAYDKIKQYGKRPLIWGDVLIKHPDLLERLPKDMIFIDWGYDGPYQFDRHCEQLAKTGLDFMCAPGTTSWASFTGRTYDWLENITNACQAIKRHKGMGVLLTDWGDFGHLQYWPISYPPLVFMGLYSYRMKEGTFLQVKHYLNKFIFEDDKGLTADFLIDFGHFNRFDDEYGGNGSQTFYSFMWMVVASEEEKPAEYYLEKTKYNKLSEDKYLLRKEYLDFKLKEIDKCDCPLFIKAEMKQTIALLKAIDNVRIAYNEKVKNEERKKRLEEALKSSSKLIEGHRRIWLARNRRGGLDSSASYLQRFAQFINETINYLSKRGEGYEKEN